MKKVVFLLGSLAICLFSWTVAEQFNASYFNFLIDKKVENKSNLQDKKLFLQQVLGLLESPEFEQSEFSSLFKQVRIHCDEVLNQLQNNQEKNKKKTETSLDLEGIDEEKVREAVLSRHNEERKNNGLSPYTYQNLFEKSATTWSKTIVEEGRSSNFHKRKSTDGYYSYQSLMQRFENLGITFRTLTGGRTAFTESVGYGYYSCNKSDCTDDLIAAIKTTWDGLIMPEKKSNGSHYRAVVMKHFESMGIGITLNPSQKRYYLVMHYGITPNEG